MRAEKNVEFPYRVTLHDGRMFDMIGHRDQIEEQATYLEPGIDRADIANVELLAEAPRIAA